MYKKRLKRIIDIVLSAIGLIFFFVPMCLFALIIKLDSPGPVLFKQKRVGIHKSYFSIIKFRSMSVSAPKDIPTHELKNADKYLTPWQRFIRKSSIDELPQLWNVLVGDMSIIGPRPALWNQYDLLAERDKYGANDIKPGLSGWAQINGRDTLSIEVKALLDGEYVEALNAGGFKAFKRDVNCFFGTITCVLKSTGVVEGSTNAQMPSTIEREYYKTGEAK